MLTESFRLNGTNVHVDHHYPTTTTWRLHHEANNKKAGGGESFLLQVSDAYGVSPWMVATLACFVYAGVLLLAFLSIYVCKKGLLRRLRCRANSSNNDDTLPIVDDLEEAKEDLIIGNDDEPPAYWQVVTDDWWWDGAEVATGAKKIPAPPSNGQDFCPVVASQKPL